MNATAYILHRFAAAHFCQNRSLLETVAFRQKMQTLEPLMSAVADPWRGTGLLTMLILLFYTIDSAPT